MQAVFLDAGTFGEQETFAPLKDLPLQWTFYDQTLPSEILKRAEAAEILVINKTVLTKEILQKLPLLRLVCVTATGVNCIDLEAAQQRSVTVCNIPNYSTACVPQLTLFLILALATRFVSYYEDVKKGRWQTSRHFSFFDYPIQEIRGKTLGIIGYGHIGKEVARLAIAFGMQILIAQHTDPKRSIPNALPFTEVLQQADFVTIHTPLTPVTKNLIGEKELSLLKKTACIINVSRGGIIQEEALAKALKQGTIAGAALDVLSQEPPSENHPLLDPTIPHLILTPHIGWASIEARRSLLEITRKNIDAYLRGNVQNQVKT